MDADSNANFGTDFDFFHASLRLMHNSFTFGVQCSVCSVHSLYDVTVWWCSFGVQMQMFNIAFYCFIAVSFYTYIQCIYVLYVSLSQYIFFVMFSKVLFSFIQIGPGLMFVMPSCFDNRGRIAWENFCNWKCFLCKQKFSFFFSFSIWFACKVVVMHNEAKRCKASFWKLKCSQKICLHFFPISPYIL